MSAEWTMHFYRRLQGSQDTDVFTFTKGKDTFTGFFPADNSTQLSQHVVRCLNFEAEMTWLPKNELLAINAMFHGPWYPSNSGVSCLRLSDDEAKRIKNYIFKTGAERSSIEAQYRNLQEDFVKVARRNEVLEQELLRFRGRVEQEDRPVTVADLFEPPMDTSQIEIPDMVCHKEILQNERPV